MGALEIDDGAVVAISKECNEEAWESFIVYSIGGVGISGVGRLLDILLGTVSEDWEGSLAID